MFFMEFNQCLVLAWGMNNLSLQLLLYSMDWRDLYRTHEIGED